MASPLDATPDQIPVEIVSEEEMAFLDAALAAATRPLRRGGGSGPFSRASASVCRAAAAAGDIEDAAPRRSLLREFRDKRALAVTDITATEWCEKQMEFVLVHGRPERTEAMQAGSDRHAQLEEEVIERVDVTVKSREESWAVKFMNFIVGTNQLLFEGITRELPVIGIIEGSWMIGVIDEIRMPMDGSSFHPVLVDTKTRFRPTIPSEAQKRNGRLQLMCYKYLWDNLIAEKFPSDNFFSYFDLNPGYVLSEDVKKYINTLGFDAKTLEDVLKYFRVTCHTLPRSQEQLLLRYEVQADNSLLEEHQFPHDARWVKDQIQECLNFWSGAREPKFVLGDEKWKCQFCKFAPICPKTAAPASRGCTLNAEAELL